MSFETMASRLVGWVPKLSKSEAYNQVNDAWTEIRNNRLWSFQLLEDSISTPSLVNTGTFAATLGSANLTANAAASAAITGLFNPLLTARQFRLQGLTIYNIITADFTVPTAVVITLDRPVVDPTNPTSSYQIFQSYFPAPVADFKRWIDWRDMFNGDWLDVHATRREVNIGDPQRLYYTFPHWVLGFGIDNRGAGTPTPSATLGFPWYELYPNPTQIISYMRWGVRTGADLVQPGDTLPYPITDKMVLARARMLAYAFNEANRDPNVARGQSANSQFLYQAAEDEYNIEMKIIGKKDRDIVDLFLSKVVRDNGPAKLPYYNTLTGRAYGSGN
jgi:hypothetical protein